jgi:hypothetical protein
MIGLTTGSIANAGDLQGPARFCGFSPIIDLKEGEAVTVLRGGIHSGTFLWSGSFGALEVRGIGWASKPRGRTRDKATSKGHAIFAERQIEGEYVVAIWNRANGAAYFSSKQRLTKEQLAAIDRVDLFDENDPEPLGCKLRTVFVWE